LKERASKAGILRMTDSACCRLTVEAVARSHFLSAILILASLLAFGSCASRPPVVTVTCEHLNMETVSANASIVDMGTFSVKPPSDGTWCRPKDYPGVLFATFPLLGQTLTKRPSDREIANTYVLEPFLVSFTHIRHA